MVVKMLYKKKNLNFWFFFFKENNGVNVFGVGWSVVYFYVGLYEYSLILY